jgi:hypothetical protein
VAPNPVSRVGLTGFAGRLDDHNDRAMSGSVFWRVPLVVVPYSRDTRVVAKEV